LPVKRSSSHPAASEPQIAVDIVQSFEVKFVAKKIWKVVGRPDWVVSIIMIECGEHPDIFIIASHPILESCARERLRE
jgi:hypothetical protein